MFYFFQTLVWTRTKQRGSGKLGISPCRKLFKTEGFERGAERRLVLAKRSPSPAALQGSIELPERTAKMQSYHF